MVTASEQKRQGFTLVELLVVIAIISIIAGLTIPVVMSGTEGGHKIQCMNNLKGIHTAAFLYARKANAFPIAPNRRPGHEPRAHESLSALLATRFGEGLEPKTFVCPASDAEPALLEDGSDMALEGPMHFLLEEENLSYAWRGARTRMSKRCILASDKYYDGYEDSDGVHSGHRGYIVVVDSSGSVREVDIDHPSLTEEKLPPGLVR